MDKEQLLAQQYLDIASVIIVALDNDGKVIIINKKGCQILGYEREEIIGKNWFENFIPQTHRKPVMDTFKKIVSGEFKLPDSYENPILTKSGEERMILWNNSTIETWNDQPNHGGSLGTLSSGSDITELKMIESRLRRSNRQLRMLSDCNQELIRASEEHTFLYNICNIITRIGGYRLAWISYAANDANKSITPVAQAGFEGGYLETVKLTWADTERGHGPTGTAIRTGKLSICENVLTDPKFAPWRDEAVKRDFAAAISLPLIINDKIIGALSIYTSDLNTFDKDEIAILDELSKDLAYGISMIRLREEHRKHETLLRESEEKFRTLTETTSAGVMIFSEKDIIYINPATTAISGYTAEDFKKKTFWDLIHPDNREMVKERGFARLHGDHPPSNYEFKIIAKDGTERWIYVSANGIKANGKPCVLSTFFDFTERKQYEVELNRTKEELERKVRELQIFSRSAVDRELKMVELKKRIEELEQMIHGKP